MAACAEAKKPIANAAKHCRDIQRYGSAVDLRGKMMQINVFVSHPNGVSWTASEKEQVLTTLIPASNAWLTKQAQRYNSSLSVESLNIGLESDVVIKSKDLDKDSTEATDVFLAEFYKQMKVSDGKAYFQNLKKQYEFDNAYLVFFIRENGMAFASPQFEDMQSDKNSFLEPVFMFYSAEEGVPNLVHRSEKIILPHEILHVFGAYDLYKENQTPEAYKLVLEKISHSVMNGIGEGDIEAMDGKDAEDYRPDDFYLDPLTAYLINLNPKHEPWFDILTRECL
jgi:hypothetical protein